MCEVINEEEEFFFTWHRTMDNCYAINCSCKTSLVCSSTKLNIAEL